MRYRISVIILMLLLVPCCCFSGSLDVSDSLNSRLKPVFLGISYKLSAPLFSSFSIGETYRINGVKTDRVVGLKSDILLDADKAMKDFNNFNFSEEYVPKYDNNIFGLSFIFGYSFRNLRVELEGSYKKFDVIDTKNHLVDNNYRHIALVRSNPPTLYDYFVLKNDGVEFYSTILNICYDFAVDTNIVPFSCVGIGEDIIKIFDSIRFKPSFNSKLGINYLMSQDMLLFFDVYYHRVVGNEYNNIPVQYVSLPNPLNISAAAKLDMEYFGAEIGIKVFV
ncbi:P44/Msp2 family outer membrane protein [Ehrlichia chaffeensis]|uniref:P44/Msp2 family outer membrane protein n=1 Tax=Ehrlichia chaffeensis TaxID=945 RepID=UPI000444EC5C|nr:P44/Msp2 family outer membrane protein [Ehrlichia chaffeensis]AHX08668.1 surface antigen family protein [Ehrlichia chaffeensis str. Saint Vincent]